MAGIAKRMEEPWDDRVNECVEKIWFPRGSMGLVYLVYLHIHLVDLYGKRR